MYSAFAIIFAGTIFWPFLIKKKIIVEKISSSFLIIFIYFAGAAAIFSGYYGKNVFVDKSMTGGIVPIVEGTALKPYVYRQFVIWLSGFMEKIIPEKYLMAVSSKFYPEHTFSKTGKEALEKIGRSRYMLIYYIVFCFLFASLFVLRSINLKLSISEPAATMSPLVLGMMLPYFQTQGGAFYDFPELFFMALAVFMSLSGKWLLLLIITIFATFNKEAFLFFVIGLYPLLRSVFNTNKAAFITTSCFFLALLVNVLVKLIYADNGGSAVEFHLFDFIVLPLYWHIHVWFQDTYGVIGPKNILTVFVFIAMFMGIIWKVWPKLQVPIRQHFFFFFPINLLLHLLFAFPTEIRTFSMIFISISIMLSVFISATFQNGEKMVESGLRSLTTECTEKKEKIRKLIGYNNAFWLWLILIPPSAVFLCGVFKSSVVNFFVLWFFKFLPF